MKQKYWGYLKLRQISKINLFVNIINCLKPLAIFVNSSIFHADYTAWKVSKYGVISGPYFPVFGLNTGKYGSEIIPYLDTFHAVLVAHEYLKVFIVKESEG